MLARAPTARVHQLLKTGKLSLSTTRGDISAADAARWRAEREEEARRPGGPALPPAEGKLEDLRVDYKLSQGSDWSMLLGLRYKTALSIGETQTAIVAPDWEQRLLPVQDERLQIPPPEVRKSFRYAGEFRTGSHLAAWRHQLEQWPDTQPACADILLAIHTATGLDLLSDDFAPWQRLYRFQPTGMKDSCQALLGALSSTLHAGSDIDSGVLRLRHRKYYNARRGTPPLRRVRAVVQHMQPTTLSFLAGLITLAGAMDEGETRALDRYWGYLWANERLFCPSPTFNGGGLDLTLPSLLSRLSVKLRGQLLAGHRVAIASLSPSDLRALDRQLEPRLADIHSRLNYQEYERPKWLLLSRDEQLLCQYSTYDPEGRGARTFLESVQPGQLTSQPPDLDTGVPPLLVGAPLLRTEFRLHLLDESGVNRGGFGVFYVSHPAPYQFLRPPREQASDAELR